MDQTETMPALPGVTGERSDLIPLLQFFQKEYGYISQEHVRQIAHFLKISENAVYGVASFYAQFRFGRPGENSIRVCLGTACHVQGSAQLSQAVQDQLNVRPGETSGDGRFEYQEVACLGCCAQASVVEINGKIYGKMTLERLDKVLEAYEKL